MTIAVVHAISMNNRRAGRPSALAAAVANTAATIGFYGLAASTAYVIDWGEGSPDSAVTSNGSGVVSTTHTFKSAGAYSVTLHNAANSATVIGTSPVNVGGGVVVPGTVTHAESASFDFLLRPSTSYTVDWGDGTSLDSISTSAGTNERQTLTVTGSPTGGTFIPTILGVATGAVAYNASVSAFQALVDAKPTLVGNVTVGGSAGAWTLSYSDDAAQTDVTATSVNAAGLTGGTSPGVTVGTSIPGVVPGKATATHTYAAAGAKTITVKDAGTNQVAVTKAVTVV